MLTNPRQLTYVVDITATFPEDDILFIYCVSRLPQARQVSLRLRVGCCVECFGRIEEAATPKCFL